MRKKDLLKNFLLTTVLASVPGSFAQGQPIVVFDLAVTPTDGGDLGRVLGASGSGSFGVPVAGALDIDGDGYADSAIAFMTASPGGLLRAGEVDLIFGDRTVSGTLDTAFDSPRVLRIYGEQVKETAGSEIWIDDVTGDGLGDLLICRQNYTYDGRVGTGALSIVVGGAGLRTYAATLAPLLLAAPPPAATVTHVLGAEYSGRFCIWVRTGDVDGDGTVDLVVGADQESVGSATHDGAVYVLTGGAHLATGATYDLADWAAATEPQLAGRVARVANTGDHHHFGATCQIADLDGNGKGEVLAASTLNRSGAGLAPSGGGVHAAGGAGKGELYILWDDNFTPPWPDVFEMTTSAPPGSRTKIAGGTLNLKFGEEIVGGLDFDGDTEADLFVGDLTGDGTGGARQYSGVGHVFYDAATLKGQTFNMTSPPAGHTMILGPNPTAIGGDTVAQADFNGDGLGDLVFCSPHGNPQGRATAGVAHVLLGRVGGWPATVDTESLPAPALVEVVEIQGAKAGDTLCYSAAAGDVDDDGRPELVMNEMLGDGSTAVNVGNLVIVRPWPSPLLFRDGFESGTTSEWSGTVGRQAPRP